MKRYTALGLFALSFAVPLCATAQAPANAGFAKALANSSTSPSYALVTIVNDTTKTRRVVCTEANFVIGALHSQFHIPYTEAGQRKVKNMAHANTARVFQLSNRKALANVQPRYSPQILAQVQTKLKQVSTSELVKEMSDGRLEQIYERSKNWGAYRDALAYVLLERGLQVGQADMTGGLYLSR